MNAESHAVKIQILQVPDCANVPHVRETVQRVLARCGIKAAVEDVIGEYPSPTLLVDGRDVTGRPVHEDCGACRLDLPTEQQILAALGAAHQGRDEGAE